MIASGRVILALATSILLSIHALALAWDSASIEYASGNRTQVLRAGLQAPSPHVFSSTTASRIALHWELSLAYWRMNRAGKDASRSLIDLGVTPFVRLSGENSGGVYGEAGIGLHGFSGQYDNNVRILSSKLQFVSRLGLGYAAQNGMELSLLIEHASNGGCQQPNDGVNFVALRLMHRF